MINDVEAIRAFARGAGCEALDMIETMPAEHAERLRAGLREVARMAAEQAWVRGATACRDHIAEFLEVQGVAHLREVSARYVRPIEIRCTEHKK